jgi:hypothetical protein
MINLVASLLPLKFYNFIMKGNGLSCAYDC